jgi:hypothetical protein
VISFSRRTIGHRTSLTLLIWAAIVAVVACSKLPIQELDLTATHWVLVAVDDHPVDSASPTEVVFHELNRATVAGPCKIVDVEVALDTDGSALGFGELTTRPVYCPTSGDAETSYVDEILATEEWRVIDQSTIEFLGPNRLKLRRMDEALVTFRHAE